jgi:hypothetical protein
VTPVGWILVLVGLGLMVLGYLRTRQPYARLRALESIKAQEENVARYGAWRGGVRDDASKTGAAVAMEILQRQVRVGAGIGFAGIALIVVALFIR